MLQDPDSQYWYRVAGWRDRNETFRTAPVAGPDAKLKFLVFGDMGAVSKKKCPGAKETVIALTNEVASGSYDMILHIGDLAYADGTHEKWDNFMDSIEPFSSKLPYMVGVGNHEVGYDGGSHNDPTGGWVPLLLLC